MNELDRSDEAGPDSVVAGLVRSSIAPVLAEPRISSSQTTQYVLGHRLDLLAREGAWWQIRGEDGYEGWLHEGYLEVGDLGWAQAWERGEGGESVISLGAVLVDDDEEGMARLPWGARLLRVQPGRYRLPDGRVGSLGSGEVVTAQRVRDRFPCHPESILRSAQRWLGTPYLWGGVTPTGADCSGFVQSVYWMHGLALPRDSYLQADIGTTVLEKFGIDPDFSLLRPADLLFFAENGAERVTHVAISLGGSKIIHSALSNGGVSTNDLAGGLDLEVRLRESLVSARRSIMANSAPSLRDDDRSSRE